MSDFDDDLLLKKRARRRLVGAVVFASFVAVFLPFLMDENPNPKIDDVLVKIPPAAPVENIPSILPDSAIPTWPAQNQSVNGFSNDSFNDSLKENLDHLMPKEVIKKEVKEPLKEMKKEIKQEVKKENKELPQSLPKTDKQAILAAKRKAAEKEAQQNKDESLRVAAILEGREYAIRSENDWVIMIGTFSNTNNVKNLRAKLKNINVPSFTETLPNQQIRVRAGPFKTQQAAESALNKMQSAGMDGKIISAQ